MTPEDQTQTAFMDGPWTPERADESGRVDKPKEDEFGDTIASMSARSFRDAWDTAVNAGKIQVNADDPRILTAFKQSNQYITDMATAGALTLQGATEAAAGAIGEVFGGDSGNEEMLATDIMGMFESAEGLGPASMVGKTENAVETTTEALKDIKLRANQPSALEADTLHIFGGLGGKAAPTKDFKEAEKRFLEGDDPKAIWESTSWFQDPTDNKWKYEISDKESYFDWGTLKPEFTKRKKATGTVNMSISLPGALDHKKLYENYPELQGATVTFKKMPERVFGAYYPGTNTFEINPDLPEDVMHSTLLHEIQHWVQDKEMFSQGANTSQYASAPEVRSIAKSLQDLENKFPDTNLVPDSVKKQIAQLKYELENMQYNFYAGKGGEIESRLVQDRKFGLGHEKEFPLEGREFMLMQEGPVKRNTKGDLYKDVPKNISIEIPSPYWNDTAIANEIMLRDKDTRELFSKFNETFDMPASAYTPAVKDARNFRLELIDAGAVSDDDAKLFNYPNIVTSDGRTPILAYQDKDGRNFGMYLSDYLGNVAKKKDTADLRFGVPEAPYLDLTNEPELMELPEDTGFAEGGMVEEEQMNKIMQEGGMADDGMTHEPATGNEIPPGSLASEVRDDIDVKLSEGEYVVPADVLRYYGVRFFEDLRAQAKQGMAEMDSEGRIGGTPVTEEGVPTENAEEALTPEEEQMLMEALGAGDTGMAVGGVVEAPQAFDRTQFSSGNYTMPQLENTGMTTKKYINPQTKEVRELNFIGTTPVGAVPEGFVPWTQELADAPVEPNKPVVSVPSITQNNRPEGAGAKAPSTPSTTAGAGDKEAGGGAYAGWAKDNYEAISKDPYGFGMNALAGIDKAPSGLLGKTVDRLTGGVGGIIGGLGTASAISDAQAALSRVTDEKQRASLQAAIDKASASIDSPLLGFSVDAGLTATGKNKAKAISWFESLTKPKTATATTTTAKPKTTTTTPTKSGLGTSSTSRGVSYTSDANSKGEFSQRTATGSTAPTTSPRPQSRPASLAGGVKSGSGGGQSKGSTGSSSAGSRTESRRAKGGLVTKEQSKAKKSDKGLASKTKS